MPETCAESKSTHRKWERIMLIGTCLKEMYAQLRCDIPNITQRYYIKYAGLTEELRAIFRHTNKKIYLVLRRHVSPLTKWMPYNQFHRSHQISYISWHILFSTLYFMFILLVFRISVKLKNSIGYDFLKIKWTNIQHAFSGWKYRKKIIVHLEHWLVQSDSKSSFYVIQSI